MVMYTTSKAAINKPDFALDNLQEHAFADFYRKMPTRIPGTIRLFDRKDYYSAHGEDAVYIADNVYHTKTVLKYFKSRSQSSSGDGLPSCTLSKSVAINFLREAITAKQLRIELWVQSSSSKSSAANWELDKQASPGNFEEVEDLLFDSSHQNITESPMCLAITFKVKDGIKTVGIAYIDSVERRLGVTEFVENDILSNTESLLIQLGVKEVLIPAEEKTTEIEAQKLRKLVERCGIVFTERKRTSFTVKNVDQDLNGLLKGNLDVTSLPVFDQKLAMAACNALIQYLDLLGSDIHRGAYELHSHDLSQYMKLDSSAVKALTLMPDPTAPGVASATGMGATGSIVTGRAGKDSSASLFGLLNKCKTGQGTRLLAMWLKQPLVNLHQIENRQQLVEFFVERSNNRNTIRDDYLKAMPDFQRLSKKFQAGRATLEDVVRVYQAITKLPEILDTLMEIGRERKQKEWVVSDEAAAALMDENYCNSLSVCIENTSKLIELVETTIDFDTRDHQITIKAEFDTTLQEISKKLQKIKSSLNKEFEDTAEDLGFDSGNPKKCPLNFENHQVYGHCFRLTRKEATAIKGKKNYIELANRQNGCFFTTKELKRLNEGFADLQETYERKQSTLAKEVISIAGSYAPSLEEINGVIAHLDVITSFAHVANNAPIAYVKPKVLEKGTGDLILKESRHPCLETLPDINFIANDVEMKKDQSEFQIITGANTGGKSVYLRQIGCIALMAQVGSFVPAEEAQVPIFDCILARVGAGDSQLKGISTFMAEMLETATILKAATKNSLIIIDELGRGTSTYDGFGLAWAISEHIASKIRCFALFATHFHDLTTLSEQIPHVTNLHVMAHVEEKSDSITGRDIVMLYKVKPGISDQSFGIHVAELAKFPDEVVRLAKRKADELEETIEENLPEGHPEKQTKFTNEEIAEGTALVSEMLQAWAAKSVDDLSPEMLAGTQESNTEMADTDEAKQAVDAKLQKEMTLLKQCFEEFRPRLEKSAWAMTALLDTY